MPSRFDSLKSVLSLKHFPLNRSRYCNIRGEIRRNADFSLGNQRPPGWCNPVTFFRILVLYSYLFCVGTFSRTTRMSTRPAVFWTNHGCIAQRVQHSLRWSISSNFVNSPFRAFGTKMLLLFLPDVCNSVERLMIHQCTLQKMACHTSLSRRKC